MWASPPDPAAEARTRAVQPVDLRRTFLRPAVYDLPWLASEADPQHESAGDLLTMVSPWSPGIPWTAVGASTAHTGSSILQTTCSGNRRRSAPRCCARLPTHPERCPRPPAAVLMGLAATPWPGQDGAGRQVRATLPVHILTRTPEQMHEQGILATPNGRTVRTGEPRPWEWCSSSRVAVRVSATMP